ncbi:MAG: hypothetical protein ACXWC9_07960 [Pseudobdellovibrionaceae bacterium]
MPGSDLPEKLRLFIFQYIDSVEVIEVLIYLKNSPLKWHTADDISRELRSSRLSVQGRLEILKSIGVIEENSDAQGSFHFHPKNAELNELVHQLLEEYRVRRHKLLELIFSPIKEVRKFANAFLLVKDSEKKGGDRG